MTGYIFLSFSISVLLIPIVIMLCKKANWFDTLNERKLHKGKIPRLGSIGFVPAFAITTFLFYFFNVNTRVIDILPMVIAGLIIFGFGILDDFKDLPARFKLVVQIIASLVMIGNGFCFTSIGPFQLGWVGYIITFFWFIGIINAFNLIDGVDALCGGISLLILVALGIIYIMFGTTEEAGLCFILAAAVLGFLIYNKPKAKIFMGDGGSQFLGFMIATLSLSPLKQTAHEYNRFLAVTLLVCIPVFDTFAAIWRRKREHRPFFTPDKMHLHHKLVNMGYTTKVILFFLYTIQIGLCVLAVCGMWVKGLKGAFILASGFFAMILFFAIIHYTNRAVIRKQTLGLNEDEAKILSD